MLPDSEGDGDDVGGGVDGVGADVAARVESNKVEICRNLISFTVVLRFSFVIAVAQLTWSM